MNKPDQVVSLDRENPFIADSLKFVTGHIENYREGRNQELEDLRRKLENTDSISKDDFMRLMGLYDMFNGVLPEALVSVHRLSQR